MFKKMTRKDLGYIREMANVPLWKRFFLRSYSSAIVAVVILILIFSIFTDSFTSAYNIYNLSRTTAIYGFIGASQVILMVIGDMNLGIGACGALTTVLMGTLMVDYGVPTIPAVAAALTMAILCGWMIGLMVVKLRLNPWIITLAMSFVFTGLAIGYTHGYPYSMPDDLTWIGRTKITSTFSFLAVLMLLFVILLYVMFRHTRFGRNVLAVGGNRTAARMSGINVDGTIMQRSTRTSRSCTRCAMNMHGFLVDGDNVRIPKIGCGGSCRLCGW